MVFFGSLHFRPANHLTFSSLELSRNSPAALFIATAAARKRIMNLKMISNIVLNSFDLIIRVLMIAVCFINPNFHFYGFIMLLTLWIPSFVIASTAFCGSKLYKRIGYYILTVMLPYPFLQIITRMKSFDLFMEAVKDQIFDERHFMQLNIVSSSMQASTIVIFILKGEISSSG